MECKGCGKEMGNGEASIEFCDGLCVGCYGTICPSCRHPVEVHRIDPLGWNCNGDAQCACPNTPKDVISLAKSKSHK